MTVKKKNYLRGEQHPLVRHSEATVREAKRLMAEAKHDRIMARGEIERISQQTGIPVKTLHMIRQGRSWSWLDAEPAPEPAPEPATTH
jgi:hypothetical protein